MGSRVLDSRSSATGRGLVKAAVARNSRGKYTGPVASPDTKHTPTPMYSVSEMQEVMVEVLQEHLVTEPAASIESFRRSRPKRCRTPVSTVVGYTPRETWRQQVRAMIKGFIENTSLRQPNGRWVLSDFEVTLEEVQKVRTLHLQRRVLDDGSYVDDSHDVATRQPFLMMGMQLVDMSNSADIKYRMGRPDMDSGGDAPNLSSLPKEVLEAFAARSAREQSAETENNSLREDNEALREDNQALAKRLSRLESLLEKVLEAQTSKDVDRAEPLADTVKPAE